MMAQDEPGYLKALKEQQRRARAARHGGDRQTSGGAAPNPAEREAIKWAREVAGREPQVVRDLSGNRCAILFKPASIDGRAPITLEGVADRTALVGRLGEAESHGQEVLGCYELSSARPLTWERQGGKVVFQAGPVRQVAKALSPAQMLRQARAQAEQMARSRKPDDRGRGGGGRSSR
jgi:hypothetical protein